jgi:hypothetical protein
MIIGTKLQTAEIRDTIKLVNIQMQHFSNTVVVISKLNIDMAWIMKTTAFVCSIYNQRTQLAQKKLQYGTGRVRCWSFDSGFDYVSDDLHT